MFLKQLHPYTYQQSDKSGNIFLWGLYQGLQSIQNHPRKEDKYQYTPYYHQRQRMDQDMQLHTFSLCCFHNNPMRMNTLLCIGWYCYQPMYLWDIS